MNQYNDNELLYLIYECEEDALGILFKRYEPLIKKRLFDYHVSRDDYEDYYQECLMSLYLAVRIYNPMYDKSFNKFFDLVVTRRIRTLLNRQRLKNIDAIPLDDVNYLRDSSDNFNYEDEILSDIKDDRIRFNNQVLSIDSFSEWEKEVFKLRFVSGYDIKEIASLKNEDIRKVYNSLYRIKKKLKSALPIEKLN